MKLRNKLALVLATAMVATSVPVVTMASASINIKQTQGVVEKDKSSTGAALTVKFEDHDATDGPVEMLYMTFENAEWNSDALLAAEGKGEILFSSASAKTETELKTLKEEYSEIYANAMKDVTGETGAELKDDFYVLRDRNYNNYVIFVEKHKDKIFKVTIVDTTSDGAYYDSEKLTIPLVTKLTGGTATVAVTGEGATASTLGDKEYSYKFASTGEDDGEVAADDPTSFYKKGELAKLTFKDCFVNSINAEDFVFELELQDPDYEFINVDDIEIEGFYGYGKFGKQKIGDVDGIVAKLDPNEKKDYGLLRITIPAGTLGTADAVGRFELTNVWVKTTEDDPSEGDFKVKVSGKDTDIVNDGTLVLAKIVPYSHYIEMDDEKVVEIKAGRQEDVKFKVGEYIDDCFVGGRDLTITLDNEDTYFIVDDAIVDTCIAQNNDGYVFDEGTTEFEKIITDSEKDMDFTVESVSFKWDDDYAPSDKKDGDAKYCRATAIVVTMSQKNNSDGKNINTNGEEDWFKVETAVYVPVDQLKKVDEGKATIKLKADGMAMVEEAQQDAVLIKKPFDVTFDTSVLKVGLQSQVGQDITFAETDKEMLEKGDLWLDIASDKKGGDGITIEDKGEYSITAGDLKKTDFGDNGDQRLELTVKRQSGSAATVVFDDPVITVDRTVPEGNYALELGGDAIDKYDGTIKYDNYITIGTANTQDIGASNGLVKGTASFKIGETKYTAIDGTEVTMDAASYIQDPGYTMVPVKYVALAFGITEDCISYSNGKIAIITGSKAIGLERNSNIATVNGVEVPMSTKVTIKDGRTYAPIADVAKILGITPAWDSATKTASFTNK